jgi:hypothetical protein
MKHQRSLLIGFAFLVGIPMCLLASGMSPVALIADFMALQQIKDTELVVRSVAGIFLWAMWLYGAVNVLVQSFKLKRYGSIEPSDRLFRKTTAAFVIALWLFSTQASSKSAGESKDSNITLVGLTATEQEHQRSDRSLVPSGFAMMSLLSLVESGHRRKLQLSLRGMREHQLSTESRMYWSQLRYRNSIPPSESGLSGTTIPKSVVATMNDRGEVFEQFESGIIESPVVFIPIGKIGEETVLLSLAENDQISICSDHETDAQEFGQFINCFLSASIVRTKSVQYGFVESAQIKISQKEDLWVIEPGAVVFTPFVFRKQEADSLQALQDVLSKPLVKKPVVSDLGEFGGWRICVRIMGPVEVADRSWGTLRFERSKSAELLTWLVMHRERPTRIAARTALWEMSIEDSTFNNVVSGIRKVINQNGQNLLERESNDVLKVGAEVITDVQILEAAIERVKEKGADEDFITLRDALDLVRDLPFAGEDFVWADTEGITSNVVLTVITGALMLSDFYLSRQDLNGVFWATGQGLKALRGHEELIALRMKAHAQQRNISGINSEWLAYERVRIADDRFLDREHNEIAKLRNSLLASI